MSRRICDARSYSSVLESVSGAGALYSGKQEREARQVKSLSEKLNSALRWLVKHVTVSSRDLNAVQPHEREEEREPHVAREIRLKWDF